MAIKKITELAAANSVANSDLLVTVTSPSGSAATKKITVQNFFGNVSTTVAVNNTATITTLTAGSMTAGVTTFQANVTVNGTLLSNNLILLTNSTPANSTSTAITKGTIFYDSNYIYIATANNIVKRATLSTF